MKRVKRGVGRPRLEDPRSYRLEVRLNLKEIKTINGICGASGLTQAELIRSLIDMAEEHHEWFGLCEE